MELTTIEPVGVEEVGYGTDWTRGQRMEDRRTTRNPCVHATD